MSATTATTTATTITTREERWSHANFVGMTTLWKFSVEHQAHMRHLQQLLADVDHWKNDPYEVARYLVEYHYNVEKAAKMFRNMVAWRRANHMETFLADYGLPPEIVQYLPLYLLRDLDYDGDPLYVLRVGAFDAWGMYQQLGPEGLLDYTKFLQEITTTRHLHWNPASHIPDSWQWQTHYYEPLSKRRLRQFTMLVDLEGLSHKHLRPALLGLLKTVARIGQDDYAGFGKRILILRAPRIFALAWKVAKHFFDAHIQQLLFFTTAADYLDVCDEYFDRRALPPCMMCPTTADDGRGGPMPGFFEHVRMEGGPVPTDWDRESKISTVAPTSTARKETADTGTTSDGDDESDGQGEVATTTTGPSKRSPTGAATCTTVSLCKGRLDRDHKVVVLVGRSVI